MTTHNMRIKKLHLHNTAYFALESIPNMHRKTVETLLGLINSDGNYGTIAQDQLMLKVGQILKYIPGACPRSLMILVDLLDIPVPEPLTTIQAPADSLQLSGLIVDCLVEQSTCQEPGIK